MTSWIKMEPAPQHWLQPKRSEPVLWHCPFRAKFVIRPEIFIFRGNRSSLHRLRKGTFRYFRTTLLEAFFLIWATSPELEGVANYRTLLKTDFVAQIMSGSKSIDEIIKIKVWFQLKSTNFWWIFINFWFNSFDYE